MSEPNWQTDVYLILAHPDEPSVLMYPGVDGWTLPHVHIDGRLYSSRAGMINAAVRQRWGLETTILRCVFASRDDEVHQQVFVYTAETRQPADKVVAGAMWVNRERLEGL